MIQNKNINQIDPTAYALCSQLIPPPIYAFEPLFPFQMNASMWESNGQKQIPPNLMREQPIQIEPTKDEYSPMDQSENGSQTTNQSFSQRNRSPQSFTKNKQRLCIAFITSVVNPLPLTSCVRHLWSAFARSCALSTCLRIFSKGIKELEQQARVKAFYRRNQLSKFTQQDLQQAVTIIRDAILTQLTRQVIESHFCKRGQQVAKELLLMMRYSFQKRIVPKQMNKVQRMHLKNNVKNRTFLGEITINVLQIQDLDN